MTSASMHFPCISAYTVTVQHERLNQPGIRPRYRPVASTNVNIQEVQACRPPARLALPTLQGLEVCRNHAMPEPAPHTEPGRACLDAH